MVYIHGGGFQWGTAHIQGPNFIMDEQIVLITFNYRLGAFGKQNYYTLQCSVLTVLIDTIKFGCFDVTTTTRIFEHWRRSHPREYGNEGPSGSIELGKK